MSEIKQSIRIKSPKARVFNALTSGQELMRWFPSRVESDARPGGKFKFVFEFNAAEQNGTQEGAYIATTPNEKFSYGWTVKPSGLATTVSISLTETDGETTVNLVHSGWPDNPEGEKMRDGHAGPWSFYLPNLKAYLEIGADERAAKLGQKIY